MVRIRRFGIVKTASVLALLYGVAALVFFAIVALFVLLAGAQQPDLPGGFSFGAGAAGLLIGGLVAAVIYGLIGWVFTAIFCLLYNLVAGWIGGVEIELQAVAVPAPAAPPAPPAPPAAPAPPSEPSQPA